MKKETLHADLKDYWQPPSPQFPIGMVHHPLIVEVVPDTEYCSYLNAHYLCQRERLDKARKNKDWNAYVWIHARPYRLDAFAKINEFVEDRLYWTTLGEIWIDTEGAHINSEVWRILFTSTRPHRELIMSAKDFEIFHKLPDPVEVFRGFSGKFEKGLSWSTDHQMAIWYAKRFAKDQDEKPCVLTGTVSKAYIIAHFGFRGESEVVALPEHVRQTGKEFL